MRTISIDDHRHHTGFRPSSAAIRRHIRHDESPNVAARIVDRANEHPERVAVAAHDGQLTYGDLLARAGGLADELQELGIGPGSIVGVSAERSSQLPVTLLAALLRGAAYCPLERSLPAKRLELLINTARPDLIIGLPQDRDGTPVPVGDTPIVDPRSARTATGPVQAVDPGDHLAYVIHTSGSTGVPRAVGVGHRALARYMVALHRSLDITRRDRYLHTASMAFSAASRQTWFPLWLGAQLVVASEQDVGDPVDLLALMRTTEVTVWDTVPTYWARVVNTVEAFDARERAELIGPHHRLVLTTGEPLPWATPRRWASATGHSPKVVNLYSQTETAGTACTFEIPADADQAEGIVPIGYPMLDIALHLVDTDLQPVESGAIGEICIESERLSDGYLDTTEQSPDRFFSDDTAGVVRRFYRTGDLGRQRTDGVFEITGRADARIKVRGFRVEPTEVELLLERHPTVARAAIVARSTPRGNDSLVAFLELAGQNEPEAGELRTLLATHLPDYAIPSVYEFIDQLPVNSSGKLDRPELGRLEGRRVGTGVPYRPPSNDTERELVSLFAELLDGPRVGVDDDFVALGGHSLLAIDLAARIQQNRGVHLGLGDVFEYSTVAQLAERLSALEQEDPSERPVLSPVPRGQALPASSMQESLWVLDSLHPGDTFYNMHWALSLEGPLDLDALERAVERMGERHEALRTTFGWVDDDLAQIISPSLKVPLEIVDLQHLDLPERRREALRISARNADLPFDLAAGPLTRLVIIREQPDRHLLSISAHHIVSDMFSMAVLTRDLVAVYDAERSGTDCPLVDLPVQPADVAAWERATADTSRFADRLAQRAEQLKGVPRLELPTDHARGSQRTHVGVHAQAVLPRADTEKLIALARHHHATLFMTCLAGFAVLLRDRCDHDDFVVGTAVSGRGRKELEGLVGLLVNTLPIRIDLQGQPDFGETIAAVRAASTQSFAYADVPFGQLIAALNPDRTPGRQPLVETYFQFQTDPLAGIGLDDLRVERVTREGTPVAFDLELSITEVAGELRVSLGGAADLFSSDTVSSWLHDYVAVLTQSTARS